MTFQNKKIKNFLATILIACLFLPFFQSIPTEAATSIKIYDYTSKKTINYTDKQVKYVCNNKTLSLSNTPGIIRNGIALGPFKDIFETEYGLKCTLSTDSKKLTITDNKTKIVLTFGSSYALVNGVKKDMGVAPVKVKYANSGAVKYLVPTRFVAETFGFNYIWNSATSTVTMTRKINLEYNNENHTYQNALGTVMYNGKKVNTDGIPVILISNTAMVPAYSVLKKALGVTYKYVASKNSVTLKKGDITLEMTLGSTITYVNGEVIECETAPLLIKLNEYNNKEVVMVPAFFVAQVFCYDYSFDNTQKASVFTSNDKVGIWKSSVLYNVINESDLNNTIDLNSFENGGYYSVPSEIFLNVQADLIIEENKNITLEEDKNTTLEESINTDYKNYVTEILYGKNEAGIEFLKVTSLYPMIGELSESDYFNALMIPNVISSFEDYYYSDFKGDSLQGFYLLTNTDSINLLMELSDKIVPMLEVVENEVIIYFTDQESYNNLVDKGKIEIALPEGVSLSQIKDQDEYYNHRIILTLPGKYADFYNGKNIICKSGAVTSINVVENSNNTTDIIINTTKVQAYQFNESLASDGTPMITLTLGNPKEFYNKIIVLDAGHGGKDPGAVKGSTYEKDLNFKILNQLVAEYFKDSDIKVYYTRVSDVFVDLYDRADFPTEVGADFFVSLHMNANNSSSVNGTSVYYSLLNTSKSESGLTGKLMASTFAKNLSATIGTKNLGALAANFVVIRETKVPAVLIELAFLTNQSDYNKLISSTTQKKAAKSIYDTITAIFNEYPTGR